MAGQNEGQVAVVTGAASGIGKATVERFVEEGASVVGVDLDGERLAWADGDPAIVTMVCDVTDADANAEMVATAVERFGRLDAIFLNAGIAARSDIADPDIDLYDRCMDVNVKAVVLGASAALPELRKAGGGAILATGSTSGLGGDPRTWIYNASKGAVINLCRALAIDLAHEGIRVNAVCPGPVATGMTIPLRDRRPDLADEMARNVPMLRWGDPRELANVVTFLASPLATFVTGAAIPVDGGTSAKAGHFPNPGARLDD